MFKKLILSIALFGFIVGCTTVPITGRQQLSLISSSEMNAMSFQQYDEFLKENKVITNTKEANMVKTVGAKIQKAVITIRRVWINRSYQCVN